MFLQLQQQSLLLGRRPLGFTEHYYTEWDDGLGKEKISLFLLISVGSTQVPSAEIAKEAFQLLQDHFLDDLTGDPYDRFENALREINHMVNAKERELEVKFIPNVQVLIGVLQKDMLFLSQRGDAQGYLIRKRHLSSITDGLYDEKNKEDLFQNIASGILEVGDDVIFTTGQLIQYVRPSDISKIFAEQSLSEAVKELDDLLKDELEDQMALLSFEVLEKSVSSASLDEDANYSEGFDGDSLAPKKIREVFEESESKEEKKRDRIKESLSLLRGFAERQEISQFLGGFLGKAQNLGRKRLLMLIGGLAIFAVISIGVLSVTMGKQRAINDMQAKLDSAEENISQAETKGTFDKDTASVLLDSAEKLATEVLDSGYLGGQASQVLDSVKEQRDYLDNVFHVTTELKMVADLSGSLNGEKLLGIEPGNGDSYELITQTGAFEVLTDTVQSPKTFDDSDKVIAARAFPDYNTIVLLTSGGKLMEYADGNAQFADTASVTWSNGVDLATYSSKLYILDPANNQIWKYQRGNTGYGSAQEYNSSGTDISSAVSIAIDGNAWVLLNDGSLLKFLSGELVDYAIKKTPLTGTIGATQVYTELEMNQLYLMDPSGKRVLVFDKSAKTGDLTYSSQYVFDDLAGTMTDMYVDKDRNVILFTTETALYELSF
ncbi:MAG: hypothetical protein WC897_01955 [Candidatus Gracilibacteria bacterium]